MQIKSTLVQDHAYHKHPLQICPWFMKENIEREIARVHDQVSHGVQASLQDVSSKTEEASKTSTRGSNLVGSTGEGGDWSSNSTRGLRSRGGAGSSWCLCGVADDGRSVGVDWDNAGTSRWVARVNWSNRGGLSRSNGGGGNDRGTGPWS